MDSSVYFRINKPKVIYESFEDEQVVINLDTGNYYSLSETSFDIWNLIDSGITVREVTEYMGELYTGDREEIEKAVHAFIAELEKEQLIVAENRNDGGTELCREKQTNKQANPEKKIFQVPSMQKFTDMQDLLLLDPIHEVDAKGWPFAKNDSFEST